MKIFFEDILNHINEINIKDNDTLENIKYKILYILSLFYMELLLK